MGKSNQKTVKVIKEPCNKENYYTLINLNALTNAANELSGDAFKMWVYFSKNQNGYEFDLSSKHAEESFSLSKRRYDNSIQELIKAGYLVDTNTDAKKVKNSWTFYEIPLELKENKTLQQKNTSLEIEENKPCLGVDTRNNTDNTKQQMKNSLLSFEGPKDFDKMSEKEKQAYFSRHIF